MLDNIRKWVGDCGGVAQDLTEITREMTRQLANMLVREGSSQHRKIAEQIERARLAERSRPTRRTGGGRADRHRK